MPKYKVTRHLPVNLTPEELLVVGKDLANGLNELKAQEKKLDQAKSEIKSKITIAEGNIELANVKINTGEEHRNVECEVTLNVKDMTKSTVRCDTGEELSVEKLDTQELQMELRITKDKNKD